MENSFPAPPPPSSPIQHSAFSIQHFPSAFLLALLLPLPLLRVGTLPRPPAPYAALTAAAPILPPLPPTVTLLHHLALALALAWSLWKLFRRPFLATSAALLLALHPLALDLSLARLHYPFPALLTLLVLLLPFLRKSPPDAPAPSRRPRLSAALALLLLLLLLLLLFRHARLLRPCWQPDLLLAAAHTDTPPLLARLLVPFAQYVRHLRLAFMGWPLTIAPDLTPPALSSASVWIGLFWFIATFWGARAARRPWPEMSLALTSLLVIHLLTSLLPLFGLAPPADDTYAYLLLPSAALAVATLLDRQGPGLFRHVGLIALLAVLLALGHIRALQWPPTPWASAAFANPHSTTALHQLALHAAANGDSSAAADFLAEADRLQAPPP